MITYNEEGRAFWNGVRVPRTTEICVLLAPREWKADEYYLRKGVLIHRITEWNDSGELDESTVDPLLRDYLDAYRRFLRDNRFAVISREHKFFHPKYKYCGRVDMYGRFEAKSWAWVIDIKSGQPHKSDLLQAPAYLFGMKAEGITCHRCGDLYLLANGNYRFEEVKSPTSRFLTFLGGLKRWKEENK